MKDVQSLTDMEIALEMKELNESGDDPDRLEALKNEAINRSYARQNLR